MTEFYSVSPSNTQHLDGSNNSSNFLRFGQQVLTSASKLVGHIIGQVDVWCARSNTSVTGTMTVNIRKGSDDSIAYTVGSVDVSTIPQSGGFPSNPTTFGNASTSTNTYALQAGDKILAEYSGGSSSNYIRVGETTSGNTPYESGSLSRSVQYWSSQGYYNQNDPRDFAANFWDATGGGGAPPAPPPSPPPAPPPPPPTVGYVTNTALDIAGIFWSIGVGTPPPPPPPPTGTPPGPPPQGLTEFYSVSNTSPSGRFLSSTGSAGSSTSYIRVAERANSSKSQFIGKIVKQVDVHMEKIGAPKGTLTVCIRKGSDDSIAFTFGTLDVSTMPSNGYNLYQFVGLANTYALQSSDRISVEYNDPSSNKSNYIGVDENNNDPWDGQNTCAVYYTVSRVYNTNTSKDLCMNLWK